MKQTKLIFALLALLPFSRAFAQEGEIIYNDNFNHREMHADQPNHIRMLDFDNDSNSDFIIGWNEYREWHLVAFTYGNWWFENTKVLEAGDTISAVLDWFPAPINPDSDPKISFSPGYSRDSIIIGFKKQVEEDSFCYGWIRFSLDAGPEKNYKSVSDNRVPWAHGICTFIDYAYCTEPNYPLRAGQTNFDWDVIESTSPTSYTTIHPNPTTGMVTVTGENLRQAEVFNMLGQQVLSIKSEGNELRINMAELPAGIYFVNVTDSEGRKCVRKVVKE